MEYRTDNATKGHHNQTWPHLRLLRYAYDIEASKSEAESHKPQYDHANRDEEARRKLIDHVWFLMRGFGLRTSRQSTRYRHYDNVRQAIQDRSAHHEIHDSEAFAHLVLLFAAQQLIYEFRFFSKILLCIYLSSLK